jgi:Uncharacterized conserved protein
MAILRAVVDDSQGGRGAPGRVPTAPADPPVARDPPLPRRLLPLALLLCGGTLVFAFGWDDYLSLDALRRHRDTLLEWRDAHPFVTVIAFALIYVVSVALSLPGAVWMSIIAGFLFGAVGGSVIVVCAATTGATLIFLAARHAYVDILRRKAGGAIARMRCGFRENAFCYLLFLRLVPAFPFWLVNLVPAFLGVRLDTFVLGTLVGVIPGSIVYSLVGSGVDTVIDAGGKPDLGLIFTPPILIPLLGLAVLSLLPVVWRTLQSRRKQRAAD